MVDTLLNGANIVFGLAFVVLGVIAKLYTQGQEKAITALKEALLEKIKAIEDTHKEKFDGIDRRYEDLKVESKSDDAEVKTSLEKVDDIRVEQITTLHNRADSIKDALCVLSQRVSKIEAFLELLVSGKIKA